jgi:hypothetical protein
MAPPLIRKMPRRATMHSLATAYYAPTPPRRARLVRSLETLRFRSLRPLALWQAFATTASHRRHLFRRTDRRRGRAGARRARPLDRRFTSMTSAECGKAAPSAVGNVLLRSVGHVVLCWDMIQGVLVLRCGVHLPHTDLPAKTFSTLAFLVRQLMRSCVKERSRQVLSLCGRRCGSRLP